MHKSEAPPYTIVIPARYASSRLPAKALADIAGKPLIEWVWRSAVKSAAVDVVVATDDDRIFDVCKSFGADVCMTRQDHKSGTDRIAEVAAARGWSGDSIVVNLQGDEPDTLPINLDTVASCLLAHADAVMSTLCVPILSAAEFHDSSCVKVVVDHNGYALYFSRAPIPFAQSAADRSFPPTASRHVGVYAYRVGFLLEYASLAPAPLETTESLEQLRVMWHGGRIAVAVAPERPGPGVDTPEDLARVRSEFERGGHAEGE